MIFILLLLAGCNSEPKDFFKNNRSGHDSDYGVMKGGSDHVITVHGFYDDYEVCREIVEMLERDGGHYNCEALN